MQFDSILSDIQGNFKEIICKPINDKYPYHKAKDLQSMSKPRAYIQVKKLFRLDNTPMLVTDLTHEDVEGETYITKELPEEVEIMFWGDVVEFYGPDNTIPLAGTFAFVRIKSIGAVAIKFPTELSFDPE